MYGLCKGSKSKSQMLYYAPLLLLITTNFWHGVAVVICYKARTLLPCMITHSLINATSIFEKEATSDNLIFSCICMILIAVGYALYLAYADRAPERK